MESNKRENFDLLEYVRKNDTESLKAVTKVLDSLIFDIESFVDDFLPKGIDIELIQGYKKGTEFCLTKIKIRNETIKSIIQLYDTYPKSQENKAEVNIPRGHMVYMQNVHTRHIDDTLEKFIKTQKDILETDFISREEVKNEPTLDYGIWFKQTKGIK